MVALPDRTEQKTQTRFCLWYLLTTLRELADICHSIAADHKTLTLHRVIIIRGDVHFRILILCEEFKTKTGKKLTKINDFQSSLRHSQGDSNKLRAIIVMLTTITIYHVGIQFHLPKKKEIHKHLCRTTLCVKQITNYAVVNHLPKERKLIKSHEKYQLV